MNQDKNIRNSQGQDVQEPGKYSENEYLPDCPFLLGRQQVEWFKHFQRERDEHTITSVDDFLKSARKDPKPIKESFTSNVINKSKSVSREEKKNNVLEIQFEDPEVERICHEHGVYTIADARKVSSIKKWFYYNDKIKTFNEFKYFTGLTSIENWEFGHCSSLRSINIPDSVTSIGAFAFHGCTSLQSINIPNSVTSIGSFAFDGCRSLQSIKIPDGVTSIKRNAFYNCILLQSIKIPNSVTIIEKYSFSNCESLQSINIPNSVTIIEKGAFSDCTSLQTIYISKKHPSLRYLKGIKETKNCKFIDPNEVNESFTSNVINKSKSASQEEKRQIVTNIQFEDPLVEEICHEHGVYTIADAAKVSSIVISNYDHTTWFSSSKIKSFNEFKYFTGLEKVNIYSFISCEDLISITLPDNIKCIEEYAFYYCKSLKNINIPDSVTSIGDHAFYECNSLESINLPDRLSNIEEAAFAYCSSLLSIKIPNRITVISKALFSNCKHLQSVILPDKLDIIRSFAFCACSFLKSITLPNTVTFIGESAFEDCANLKSINIPDSVKVIKDFVFEDLSTKIYISKNHPLRKKLKEDYPGLKLYLPTKNVNESFTSNVIKKTQEKTQKDKREELFEYVNLGLPSGNLWCKHNYGAKKEEENGKYYNFNEAISLYLNNESLPNIYDFIELDRYCSHKWTKINGAKGMLFTSNENGNSVFFPGVGYEDGTGDGYIANFNRSGYYWSSTSYVDNYESYNLAINDNNVYPEDISSYSYRFSIRTIRKTNHIKESFTNNVIKKSKETSQEDKRNITLTVEGLASQIERINTNKDIEIVRFPIYLKDSPNNEIVGYDLLFKCFRDEFVDTINGKKMIETGQHRMSILFRFVLNEGEYSLAIGYLSDETYRKTYSMPNIKTSKPLRSKKIDMINLIYGDVYSKMLEKYSKEEFKKFIDIKENITKSIQFPDYIKEFKKGYPSTNIPGGFLIKQENIVPYVKECYNIFLELIDFDNKELSLYKHIEEIFEKKNITVI